MYYFPSFAKEHSHEHLEQLVPLAVSQDSAIYVT